MEKAFPAQPPDLALEASVQAGIGVPIVEIEMEFDGHLDERILARSLALLLEAEPILACRLNLDADPVWWHLVPPEERTVLVVSHSEDEFLTFRHSGIDATKGPQVAACLWQRERNDHLIVKVAHQAGDGRATLETVRLLSSIYSQLAEDSDYRPGSNKSGRRDKGQVTSRVPWYKWPMVLFQFARFISSHASFKRRQSLPLKGMDGERWLYAIRHVGTEETAMLSNYAAAHGATINDMFLAAAYRALASETAWDGVAALQLWVLVDLRRFLPNGRAGAICNLASFDFPFLGTNLGADFEETLGRVCSTMQRRKREYPGLMLAALLDIYGKWQTRHFWRFTESVKKRMEKRRRSGPGRETLTNIGLIEDVCVTFAGHQAVRAFFLPPLPPQRSAPGILIGLSGYRGTLTLSAAVSVSDLPVVDSFLDAIVHQLPIADPAPSSLARRRVTSID